MIPQEQRAARDRAATMRFSVMLWTAGAGLIVVVFAILGFSISATPQFWFRGAIAVAVLLLILRRVSGRLRVSNPRSAQPDPRSRLNLD